MQYLGANVPQAWAAGSVFALLNAILGIEPDAPHGKLNVDPELPEWLPDVTVLNLRVGPDRCDIRFWREDGETRFKVLQGDPKAVERRAFFAHLKQLEPA